MREDSFNDTTDSGVLRHPRAIFLVNGYAVKWLSIEIMTTTFYIADSYHVEIPLSDQPEGFDLNFLFSASKMTVKIYIGFPLDPNNYNTENLDLLMVGDVDKLDVDPLTRVATFSGRDLTSRLIDTKTYAKYSNKTASDVAILLANEHGLTPVVTPTNVKIGIFYTYQNTLMARETTEWDLLCFVAQQQDFVVYVEGENLIFKPRPTTDSNPYILNYTPENLSNASPVFMGTSLTIERSLTLAQDVIVKIRVPYSPQTGKAFTVKVNSRHKNLTSPGVQTFVYTFPGLSKAQALAKANQIIRDITIHEIKLNATQPGDNTLRKDSLVQLRGSGTLLDQSYFCDEVVRTISMENGYTMNISAKNHAVDTEIII